MGTSDACVEQAMGGTSVAQIFKHHGESFFRDHEVCGNMVHLYVLSKFSAPHSLACYIQDLLSSVDIYL